MKILVIFPHPDDAALNAGGTLARWVSDGHAVTAICCTPGNMGTLRLDQTARKLGLARTAELHAANQSLGIETTEVLDFPDGGILDFHALREALVRCVRTHQPDRVVTMDPWARYEVHSDHVDVGKAASEAAAFACFPLLYPDQLREGLAPHHASELWYMGLLGDRPNTYVNIERHLARKVEALLAFEATLGIIDGLFSEPEDDAPASADSMPQLKARAGRWLGKLAQRMGRPVGLAAAEAFIVQRCAPGHFDNMSSLYAKMLGEPAEPPVVID